LYLEHKAREQRIKEWDMSAREDKPRDVSRRNFWDDLAPWNTRMQDLMQDLWSRSPFPGDYAPGGELHESDEAFTVELDLPGVDKADITIDVLGRRLMVHGSRTTREHQGVMRHSTRMSGSFRYEAVLPVPVDEQAVTAALTDGVLTITMPKSTTAKATHIEVK
jgi:HSP20 family protein